jgi:hypothetical protein
MTIYYDLMQQIDDQGLLWNVKELDLRTVTGLRVPDKKAIVRQVNNVSSHDELVAVVGKNYKVVSNEEVFSAFCKNIEASAINADGAKVKVRQTSKCERALVDFTFPAESIRVRDDVSETVLQLCALNSFDGTTRYRTKAGGLRMQCLNGQILGDIVASYSCAHTASLDVDAGAATVVSMIQEFKKAENFWGALTLHRVHDYTATQVCREFLGIKECEHGETERRNSRLEQCLYLWRMYKAEMGDNAYALYNALTDYVSNPRKQYKNEAQATLLQRNKLQKLLNTHHVFQQEINMEFYQQLKEAA